MNKKFKNPYLWVCVSVLVLSGAFCLYCRIWEVPLASVPMYWDIWCARPLNMICLGCLVSMLTCRELKGRRVLLGLGCLMAAVYAGAVIWEFTIGFRNNYWLGTVRHNYWLGTVRHNYWLFVIPGFLMGLGLPKVK